METSRFCDPSDPPLAIFIMRTADGSHTGLLFQFDEDTIIQDLLWHEKFRSSPCEKKPHFVSVVLEPEQEHDVRMMCKLIHERHNETSTDKKYRIPYAFRYTNKAHLNKATAEVNLGDGFGLTCSSYVLAVFQSVGIQLVDITTWQTRADDTARHETLLKLMKEGILGWAAPASPDHIASVEKETTCFRVRPEEVAATALYETHPVAFEQLVSGGEWIMSRIPYIES